MQLNQQSPYEIKCKSDVSDILVLKKSDFLKLKNSFSNNVLDILEGSYHKFKLIQEREILNKLFYRFCGSSSLVKKKIKQLDHFILNKKYDFYKTNYLDYEEDYKFLFNLNVEEITLFLENLDDHEFINNGKRRENFVSKNIYVDTMINDDFNLKPMSKNTLISPDKKLSENNHFFYEKTEINPDNNEKEEIVYKKQSKKENKYNMGELRFIPSTRRKRHRKIRHSHNVYQKNRSLYISVPNTDKSAKRIHNLITSRYKKITEKLVKSRANYYNKIRSSYSLYYNKVFRNIDLSGGIEMFNREKELNDKTMSIMNNSILKKTPTGINYAMPNNKNRKYSEINLHSISNLFQSKSDLPMPLSNLSIEKCVNINLGPVFKRSDRIHHTFGNLSSSLAESFMVKEKKIKMKISGNEFLNFESTSDYFNQELTFKYKNDKPSIVSKECNIVVRKGENNITHSDDDFMNLIFSKLEKLYFIMKERKYDKLGISSKVYVYDEKTKLDKVDEESCKELNYELSNSTGQYKIV